MNIICVITRNPEKRWCVFLNNFLNYKIYILVGDNSFDLSEFKYSFKNIVFVTVDENVCKLNGYTNVERNTEEIINNWGKTLYYFGIENKNFDKLWLMEDDVFFYDENTLLQIDNQYNNEDLLSNLYYSDTDKNIDNKLIWNNINITYDKPYYCGSMNIIRLSSKMMECINDYALQNNTIFCVDVLFPTIAIKNNLKYMTPPELSNVNQIKKYEKKDINKKNIYHPEIELDAHIYYRKHLIPHHIEI